MKTDWADMEKQDVFAATWQKALSYMQKATDSSYRFKVIFDENNSPSYDLQ